MKRTTAACWTAGPESVTGTFPSPRERVIASIVLPKSQRDLAKFVVGAGRTHPRGVETSYELASNDALTMESEGCGAQRGLGCPLEFAGVGGDDAHRIDVEAGIR